MRRSKHGPALFELIGKDGFRTALVRPCGPPGEADGQHALNEAAESPATGRDAADDARPGLSGGRGQGSAAGHRPARRGGLESSTWAPQTLGATVEADDEPGDDSWSSEADGATSAAEGSRGRSWTPESPAERGSTERGVSPRGTPRRGVAERGFADGDSTRGGSDDDADDRHSPAAKAVEFDGARVRVSLTSMTAAAMAFAAILLVAGSFLIGKSRGRQAGLVAGYEAGRTVATTPANDLETVRQQPPSTYLIGGLLEQPADTTGATPPRHGGPAAAPRSRSRESDDRPPASDVASGTTAAARPADPAGSQTAGWVDGFTYVVVQEFPNGAREDALAAQAYLADHGVDTVVASLPAGRCQLMTTQGFDRKEPAQRKRSDQFLEKIRAIGAQYYASGGRYKLEGYLKTHKGS
jgi:hypothetical protein